MNRKERRINQRKQTIVENVIPIDFSKEDVNYDERKYEDRIAQAHELDPYQQVTHGVMGPNIPEPEEYDPY